MGVECSLGGREGGEKERVRERERERERRERERERGGDHSSKMDVGGWGEGKM